MASVDRTLCVVGGIISLNIFTIIGTYLTNIQDKTKYRLLVAQFFLISQSVLFFVARYVWLRVCTPLFKSPSIVERLLMYVVGIILVSAQCCLFIGTIFAGVEPHWFSMITYTCLGITIILATISVLVDFLWWLLAVLKIPVARNLYRENQLRCKIILILVISAMLTLYGLYNGYRQPGVTSLKISIKNLPEEFNECTVVQLSDIHLGQTVGRNMIEGTVKVVNQLQPDIVVLTGDVVDATVYQIRQAVKPLIKLKTTYGVYFVTGNHEYYSGDVDAWMKELSYLGITVLHNSHVTIQHPRNPSAILCVAGVDDVEGEIFRSGEHGMQLGKALAGLKPHTATILLAHQPKAAKIALEQSREVGLVLSGHTHGGQLFPLHLWHLLLQPYFAGLYQHERGSYVYVNRGTYYWGMPMRILSSAEITHITLLTPTRYDSSHEV